MRKAVPIIVVAVLVLLFAVRFIGLSKDPPLYYVGYGQTLLTDPYHLTYYARNAVLFHDWDPFDYHRWDVFKNSLISGVAFLTFESFAVSRVTANLAALFLTCGGLLLFLGGFFRIRRLSEIALIALVLLLNNALFLYGRLPFLETGLVFLSGLLFLVFMRFHDRWWGQVLCGVLVALAALAGKLFGLLLIVPVVLGLIYRHRKKVALPLLLTFGGVIAGGAAYVLVFYGGDFTTAMNYYREHTTGMYPFPPGLTSPMAFVKMLITYGGESGLWDFMTVQLFLVTVGGVAVLLHVPPFSEYKKESLPLIFLLAWFVAGIVGLSPFFYRPSRYALFLMLPAAALIGFVGRYVMDRDANLSLRSRLVSLPLIFLACWYTIIQFRMVVEPVGRKFHTGIEFLPIAAIAAAAVTLILFLLFQRFRRIRVGRWSAYVMGVLLLAMTAIQGLLIWKTLVGPGHNLEEYNREISRVVNPNAVLTGPYMPALTIDNHLRGVIYVFGTSMPDSGMFSRMGVTHVLANSANWRSAVKEFPQLSSSWLIANFLISDQVVGLYRLPGATVPMTDFEHGAIDMLNSQFDSALTAFTRFCALHPNTILGETRLAFAMTANGRYEEADTCLENIAAKFPRSYMTHVSCQAVYQKMFEVSNDSLYLQRAQHHQEIAAQLNPTI